MSSKPYASKGVCTFEGHSRIDVSIRAPWLNRLNAIASRLHSLAATETSVEANDAI